MGRDIIQGLPLTLVILPCSFQQGIEANHKRDFVIFGEFRNLNLLCAPISFLQLLSGARKLRNIPCSHIVILYYLLQFNKYILEKYWEISSANMDITYYNNSFCANYNSISNVVTFSNLLPKASRNWYFCLQNTIDHYINMAIANLFQWRVSALFCSSFVSISTRPNRL